MKILHFKTNFHYSDLTPEDLKIFMTTLIFGKISRVFVVLFLYVNPVGRAE
jgi:hypothetical protein